MTRRYTGPFSPCEHHHGLTAVQALPPRNGRAFASWRCNCGALRFAPLHHVRSGHIRACEACGKLVHRAAMRRSRMSRIGIDLAFRAEYTLVHQQQRCVRMATTGEPQLLSTGKVAAMLGVKPVTVKVWCRTGQLTATKTEGGHYRCSLPDVEAFLQRKVDHAFGRTGT